MTIYNALVIICWFIFLCYWLISAWGVKKNVGGFSRGMVMRVIIGVGVLALLHSQITSRFEKIQLTHSGNVFTSSIGVIFCAAGIAFAIWARRHLGRNWGMPMTIKQEPELVTSGPYTYVRHPIYTGVLLAALGSAFVSGIQWLIPFGLAGLYFLYSAQKEEQHMLHEFPKQYPTYIKKTKMLIPFIF